jgi:hypothetical protein
MRVYHNSIGGSSLTVTFAVKELTKEDQIQLLHDLMRSVGYTDAIYIFARNTAFSRAAPKARQDALTLALRQAAERFEKEPQS